MYSAAELLGYLADFGDTVTVDGVSITAVCRRQYVETNGIEGQRTTLLCRTSDVAGVAHGDAAVVATVSYTVQEIEPRDDGLTLLVLEVSA